MLAEFIEYLLGQIGQPYVWGGQHTKLTPENYVAVIKKKEANTGGYPDGETYAQAAIDFCKKRFDAGEAVLYAYDCSGLGVYWLYNLQNIWKADANANTMMHRCTDLDTAGLPTKGWWVFRLNSQKKKATHIGYMVDGQYLVEAKGRKYGVVKTKFKSSAWDVWGIPKVFADEIKNPKPEPTPPDPPEPDPPEPKKQYVLVVGASVRVRKAPRIPSKTLWIAHNAKWYKTHHQTERADLYLLLDVSENGWYHIQVLGDETHTGYITNKPQYTKLLGGDS